MADVNKKSSVFDSPVFKSRIKSANVKIFPEGALGYFLGPTLALVSNSVLANQYNNYLTDVMKVPAWFLWFLPVISVVFVVAGNILVGKLMDKLNTRAGKARPLILISIPISVLALLLLLVFPPLGNDVASLVFIAIGYNMWFAIAYPFYYTSHSATVNLSTRNSKDRSLLATISNATQLAAVGLVSMVLPMVSFLFFPTENNVVIADKSYGAWKIVAIVLIVFSALGALVEFLFKRERITEEIVNTGVKVEKKVIPMKDQAKVCFKDKFWIMIIIFFFLYQLGGMLKNVSQIYFCRAALTNLTLDMIEGQRFSAFIAMIGAVPTALGMVISWPLSNKIGKGKAIAFGAIVSTIGGLIGFIDPSSFPLVVTAFVVKALGSTPAMYLSLALLADIIDHHEAKHGIRTDGLSMTIYGAIMAGMTGVATGILNAVLGAFNFTEMATVGGAGGTEAFKWAMTFLFLGGETVCYAIIAVMFMFMKVEKFSKFDHIAIVADQKALAEKEGRVYVDPHLKMMLDEAEYVLKAKCEAENLNFDQEWAGKQAEVTEKYQAEKAKKEEKEAKRSNPAKDAETLKEFNEIRVKNGRPPISM